MGMFDWLFGKKKTAKTTTGDRQFAKAAEAGSASESAMGGLLADIQESIDDINVKAGYPKGTTIPSADRSKLDPDLMLDLARAESMRDQFLAELKEVQDYLKKD